MYPQYGYTITLWSNNIINSLDETNFILFHSPTAEALQFL